MLKLSRNLLAASLLVAGMAGAGFAESPNESLPYASTEWHFHAVFPGSPRTDTTMSTSYSGAQLVQYNVQLEQNGGNLAYVVTYRDTPVADLAMESSRGVTDSDRVASETKGMETSVAGKIVSERDVTASGVAGREFTFQRTDGNTGVFRIYAVGGRYYHVFAGWIGTAPAESEMNGFLDSFGIDN